MVSPPTKDLERRLVEKAAAPVFAVDHRGAILTWNWGCELLFGRKKSEAVGRQLTELLQAGDGPRWQKSLEEAIATESASVDLAFLRDDDLAYTHVVIRPLSEPEGKVQALAVSLRDLSEIKHLESQLYRQVWALSESEQQLRDLMPEAVVILDQDGLIRVVNDQTTNLFGYTRGELLGHPVDMLTPGVFEKMGEGPRVLPDGDPGRLYGVRKDGIEFPTELSVGPIQRDGEPMFVAAIRDITDRVQAQRRLAELERLKEMDRFKARFINTATHELKTPLTPINVHLHLLSETELSPKQRKHVEILARSAKRFNRLVEDLLDAARLQAEALGLQKESVDLDRLAKQAVESMQAVGRAKDLEIRLDVEKTPPVEADPGRLNQVIYNLLNNAVKFTEKGGEIVVMTRQREGKVVVTVSDTGIGMDAHEITHLFRPFSQLPSPHNGDSGTGLGLYVSRGIIELHGGRIWCESPGRGEGAAFSFEIPTDPHDPSESKQESVADALSAASDRE